MKTVTIPDQKLFNDATSEFINVKGQTIQLEHSLVSIKKWESKWHKPFLSETNMSREEAIDYFKCMTITQNVRDEIYEYMPDSIVKEIEKYIHDPMTATWFAKDNKQGGDKEIITNELIYYWMIQAQIPFECQKWHLNQLLTLIKVCQVKNQPPKKMTKREAIENTRRLNAARRKASAAKNKG